MAYNLKGEFDSIKHVENHFTFKRVTLFISDVVIEIVRTEIFSRISFLTQEEYQMESNEEIQQRMEQLMQSSYLDVETALGKLQLKSSDTRNVYVIGSRLWGTATEKSDWDLIIVSSSPTISGKNSMHNSDIDATVYSVLEFEQKLKEHSFLEVICLFLPKQYVWREEVDFRKGFNIQPKSLLVSVEEETGSSKCYLIR